MDVLNVTDSVLPHLSNVTREATSSAAKASCNVEKFWIHTVFAGVICLIGFVGNCVSFFALNRDKQSPVATFLLQALTLIDNMFLGIWVLQFSMKWGLRYAEVQGLHVTWSFVRLYTYPMLFASQTATIWMTVVIAATRYISICIPFRAAQLVNMDMAKKSVAGVAIFSVAYNLPRFFEGYITLPQNANDTRPFYYHVTWLGRNNLYKLIYFDILYYIFSFVLPLLVLSVLNTRLTLAYRKIQATRARMNLRTDQDNNITLVMIIVVLVFMLCQAPARIVQIVWKYEYHTCDTIKFYLTEFSNVLEVFNSSANFFIYCAFRKQFRTILIEIFCGSKYTSVPNGGSVAMNGRASIKKNKQPQTVESKC